MRKLTKISDSSRSVLTFQTQCVPKISSLVAFIIVRPGYDMPILMTAHKPLA
jgi:hypothetical protein